MPFEADLPLRPGVNIVSVYARENPDTRAQKVFIIRRDGPNGELLQTPKTDDELSESTAGGDD
jgi:carboxyl-terminal processing protease